MLRSGFEISAALLRLIGSANRTEKVLYLRNHLRWLQVNELPVEYLCRLFPEIRHIPAPVQANVDHPFELPYGERLVLSCLAVGTRPKLIFEFGTFAGSTTRLLADAAPEAKVHTIDLPDQEITWEPWLGEVIGAAFRSDPAYRGRIVEHRQNSRDFDYEPFHRKVDLVFVDASHEHADVLHDSHRALEIVSDHGLIVWDDYQPDVPGVVSALRELRADGVALAHVAETRLVVHRRNGFALDAMNVLNSRTWSRVPLRGRPSYEIRTRPFR